MATTDGLESLDDVWDEFVRVNEDYYANPEGPGDAPFELSTDVTIRLSDGREVQGVLCLFYFDNVKEVHGTDVGGHLGVQLDLNEQMGEGLLNIMPSNLPDGGSQWTRGFIELAFNINPASRIWERNVE